jgi:hypothetical protein
MFCDGKVSGRSCIDPIQLGAELSVVEVMAAQLIAARLVAAL